MANTREINYKNVNKEIKNVFSSAASLVNKISVDETVMNYAMQTSRDYWIEYKIQRYIVNSMSLYNDIDACFVYFPQHDYVISNLAGFKSLSFYNRYYNNIEYKKWLSYLDLYENGIKLINVTDDESKLYDADSYIWLVKKISLYHKTSRPVIAVVQINKKTLIRKIRQMSMTADDQFFIHDGKKILMSTLKTDEVLPIFGGIINGKYQDGEKLNFNDKSYQISSENLSLFSLTSVHAFIDLDASQANRAKYFAGFGLIFCTAITIAYCIAFSKKHSEKPKKILSLLEEGISDKIGHKGEVTVDNAIDNNRQVFINEYATIEKLVKEYIQDYVAIAEVYNRQSSKLKELYLEKLLLRGLSDEYDLKEFMKLTNNNTLNDGYAITLYVPIDEYDISESEGSKKYNAAHISKGILERTYNHLLPEGDNIYVIIVDNNHLVCIHNLRIEAMNAQEKTLSEIVEKSVNILNSLQDTEYTVFISNIYKSAYNLKDAYDEVMEKFFAKKREKEKDKETDDKPYWINSCIEIIERNYMNWDLTTSFIAEQIGLTRSYLSSSFAKYMGIGLHEYIQKYRISKAKSILMSNPDIRIADLANEIGLDNATSFIRLFKRLEGVTPGIFRNQLKEKVKEK